MVSDHLLPGSRLEAGWDVGTRHPPSCPIPGWRLPYQSDHGATRLERRGETTVAVSGDAGALCGRMDQEVFPCVVVEEEEGS